MLFQCRTRSFSRILLGLVLCTLSFVAAASAQTFQALGPIDFGPDYITVFPRGVSADGSTVVGFTLDQNGRQEAIRWAGGIRNGLGYLPGAPATAASEASAISADGETIVGWSSVALSPTGQNRTEPFLFAGGSMTGSSAGASLFTKTP